MSCQFVYQTGYNQPNQQIPSTSQIGHKNTPTSLIETTTALIDRPKSSLAKWAVSEKQSNSQTGHQEHSVKPKRKSTTRLDHCHFRKTEWLVKDRLFIHFNHGRISYNHSLLLVLSCLVMCHMRHEWRVIHDICPAWPESGGAGAGPNSVTDHWSKLTERVNI